MAAEVNFALKITNSALSMMNIVPKMMHFVTT